MKVINLWTKEIKTVYKVEAIDQFEIYFVIYDEKNGFHMVDSRFYAPYNEETFPMG